MGVEPRLKLTLSNFDKILNSQNTAATYFFKLQHIRETKNLFQIYVFSVNNKVIKNFLILSQ